ncbi:MAG: hypothetical protein WAU86_11900 [Oricola sp.]
MKEKKPLRLVGFAHRSPGAVRVGVVDGGRLKAVAGVAGTRELAASRLSEEGGKSTTGEVTPWHWSATATNTTTSASTT